MDPERLRQELRQRNAHMTDADVERAIEQTRELVPRAATKRDERAIGHKRDATGKTFQARLDGTHENYLNKGWGFVLRHHGPFVRAKDGWKPAGHARCDYSGHVNLVPPYHTSTIDEYRESGDVLPFLLHDEGVPVPVYFDAKVLGDKKAATYRHPVEAQHQLTDLRAALKGGGYAFLLVYAPEIERAFVVGMAEHFDELLRGRGIRLYETVRGRGSHGEPLLPSCEFRLDVGWHWAPQLRFIQRGEWRR